MNNRRFDLLRSVGFLLGLTLLILNDHLLKGVYGSWWTGKLSDVAGIFAFTLFSLTLFPRRPKLMGILVAVLFLLWKLPISDTFIESWNSIGLLRVGRVVDPTDLVALLMVPAALYYAQHFKPLRGGTLSTLPILLVATFAFTATSCIPGWIYDQKYTFKASRTTLIDSLKSLEGEAFVVSVNGSPSDEENFWIRVTDTTLAMTVNPPWRDTTQEALIKVVESKDGTTITLTRVVDYRAECTPMSCSTDKRTDPNDPLRKWALINFEQNVIEPLRQKLR
ncbi:MAG: hypothetical protein KDD67_01605 [Ignavibacteriae bacterium]|nr:hypothetical protein [Ignavibacteriota bacterium]MCB9215486.1 hypothetical protein [Ignavibacteria bacterium]